MPRKYNLKSESIHFLTTDPIGETLDFYGIERRNGCWVPTKNKPKNAGDVIRPLMTKLDILPRTSLLIGVKPRETICHEPLCLNPHHYRIYFRQSKIRNDADLLDLIEELDLNLYEELGEDLYLSELNRNYPPSLWITKEELRTAARLRVLRDRD